MNYSVVDIETDGLLDKMTKIHCMSINKVVDGVSTLFSLTDYGAMRTFMETEEIIVGHNFKRFDAPAAKKILGVDFSGFVIDTLPISWYLYPELEVHGLDEWGGRLDIQKPHISNWDNLPIEDYIYRCEEDTKINTKLFDMMCEYLLNIYGEPGQVMRFLRYLMFKMDCAWEQEEEKWLLDIDRCKLNIDFLEEERKKKAEQVSHIMPLDIKYKEVARPKTLVKKDGTYSVAGEKWLNLLKEKGLPEYHIGTVKVVDKTLPGNPASPAQLKSWLFGLGWVPETFRYVRENYDSPIRKIPQINLPEGQGICDSIKALYEKNPDLIHLEGLSVINHRLGLLKGFLRDVDADGYLLAQISGLTNTLRFQHTTIVNLPKVSKPYGDVVRGCLIAPPGYKLCGSDMSSLEDSTKRHYMYYYDPEYVIEMMKPGYDPHLDIAVLGNLCTEEDVTFYKAISKKKDAKEEIFPEEKTKFAVVKDVRDTAKKVNFGAVYGAGPPKLALTGRFSLSLAKLLHSTYWKRNWSVRKIADDCITKTVNEQMWLYNPVSQFWYSLRADKDKFSTLNQGTGVYCFDTQVRNARRRGIRMCGQFHDEFIFKLKEGTEEYYSKLLDEAIIETNEELKLNVKLGISKDFGYNYAEIH